MTTSTTTETFLDPSSLDVLRFLLGEKLVAYGTDLELDEGVGAFGAWLQLEQGWVNLEYAEQLVHFDAGFESVESLLRVSPLAAESPGGDPHELAGTIIGITRIQDRVTMVNKLSGEIEWDWWRDSGLRLALDSGSELVIHCASTIEIEVVMRVGPVGSVEPAPLAVRSYQEGEKRAYRYERREVPLDS